MGMGGVTGQFVNQGFGQPNVPTNMSPMQQPSFTQPMNNGFTGNTPVQNPGMQTQGQGMFGNLIGNTPQQGGLFNSNTNTSVTNAPQGTGGLFTQPKPGLFGTPTTTTPNNPQQPSPLFGNNPQQQAPTFMPQGNQQPQTGLFGVPTQPPSTGGGLFNTGTNNQPKPQTGGLFGNAPSSGLFGSSSNQQPPQQPQPNTLFGSSTLPLNTPNTQPLQGPSLFSNNGMTSNMN